MDSILTNQYNGSQKCSPTTFYANPEHARKKTIIISSLPAWVKL